MTQFSSAYRFGFSVAHALAPVKTAAGPSMLAYAGPAAAGVKKPTAGIFNSLPGPAAAGAKGFTSPSPFAKERMMRNPEPAPDMTSFPQPPSEPPTGSFKMPQLNYNAPAPTVDPGELDTSMFAQSQKVPYSEADMMADLGPKKRYGFHSSATPFGTPVQKSPASPIVAGSDNPNWAAMTAAYGSGGQGARPAQPRRQPQRPQPVNPGSVNPAALAARRPRGF